MLRKYIIFFFCLFLFNQCGFKAIYSEKNSIIASEFRPILISNNSKAVNDAFSQIFININNESDFLLKIDINEKNQPVLTNADGTISKYRIDIDVNFTLIEIETDNELFQS